MSPLGQSQRSSEPASDTTKLRGNTLLSPCQKKTLHIQASLKEDTSPPIVPILQRSHELLTTANIVHCSISMSSYTPQASNSSGFQLYVQHLAIFNSISFFSDSQILLSNYEEIIPLMPPTSQTDLNSSGHVKHSDTIRHACAFFKSSLLSRLK